MNTYEILYIISPQVNKQDTSLFREKVKNQIEKLKGEIIKEDDWGARKLAYPIKKEKRGNYVLVHFKINPEQLKKLDEKLKESSEILRFQIVKIKERKFELKPERKPRRRKIIKTKIELEKLDEKIDKILEI